MLALSGMWVGGWGWHMAMGWFISAGHIWPAALPLTACVPGLCAHPPWRKRPICNPYFRRGCEQRSRTLCTVHVLFFVLVSMEQIACDLPEARLMTAPRRPIYVWKVERERENRGKVSVFVSVPAPSAPGRDDAPPDEQASLVSHVCHHVWVDERACKCARTCVSKIMCEHLGWGYLGSHRCLMNPFILSSCQQSWRLLKLQINTCLFTPLHAGPFLSYGLLEKWEPALILPSPPPPLPLLCPPLFTLLVQKKLWEPASPLSARWLSLIFSFTRHTSRAKRSGSTRTCKTSKHKHSFIHSAMCHALPCLMPPCDSPRDASSTSHRLVTCKSFVTTRRSTHQCAAHVDYSHDTVPRRPRGCPSANSSTRSVN